MILHVTRHGETKYNAEGRYAGSTDVPLNDNGLRQAALLAEELKEKTVQFDLIAVSPLLRARQTAEIIHNATGRPVVVFSGFEERNIGVYEGLTRDEAKSRYPDLWSRLSSRHPDDAPTGGETVRQFDTRVISALERLKAEHPNTDILLVCHGFTSRIINRHLLGLTYDDMNSFVLNNCEIVSYTI